MILGRLRRGERIEHYETVRVTKDGRLIDVSLTISPIYNASGAIVGASKVARDVTREQLARTRLRRSEHKLRQQTQELEQQLIASGRLVSLGEVTASMAHEFNNPLGIIMGFAQDLLSEKDESSPDHQALKIIYAETKRCEQLIRDLLNYARPRAAAFGPTDLRSLIVATVEIVGSHLYKKKIEAATRLEDDLPAIHADRQQLEQVMVNLFLNAIDAMPNGGELKVITRRADGVVRIDVADTGEGLTAEERDRLFTPYYTTKQHGTGLGLAIVQSIVSDHGGQISVRSAKGSGTTFRMEFPLASTRAAQV